MVHTVTDSIFPCILAADGDLGLSAALPVAQASLRLHQLPALSLRHLPETGVGGDAGGPQRFLVTPLHCMTSDGRGSARLRSSCEMDGSAAGPAPTRRTRLCTFVQGDDDARHSGGHGVPRSAVQAAASFCARAAHRPGSLHGDVAQGRKRARDVHGELVSAHARPCDRTWPTPTGQIGFASGDRPEQENALQRALCGVCRL